MGRRKGNHVYTKEYLEPLVQEATSFAELCRTLHIKHGGGQWYVKQKIKNFGIDMSHFRAGIGWAKGIPNSSARRKIETIFVILPYGSNRIKGYQLYRALLESGVQEQCNICSQPPVWREKRLVLIVDHIDGNWLDNRKENLRLLCPNCETQTATYKSRNRFWKSG